MLWFIPFGHEIASLSSQLSIWCGSVHPDLELVAFCFFMQNAQDSLSGFICFLPLTGSIKISCHKAPVGGQHSGSCRVQYVSTVIPVITTGHLLLPTSLSDGY